MKSLASGALLASPMTTFSKLNCNFCNIPGGGWPFWPFALITMASRLESIYPELGLRCPTQADIASLAIAPPEVFDFAILQISFEVTDLLGPQSRFCERMAESRDHYTASILALQLSRFPYFPVSCSAAPDSFYNSPLSHSRKI